jgi:hypothetical protein
MAEQFASFWTTAGRHVTMSMNPGMNQLMIFRMTRSMRMEGWGNMRTTLNLSDQAVHEVEALYRTTNRSKAVEHAMADAMRFHRLKALMELKGKLDFDETYLAQQDEEETNEAAITGKAADPS